MPTEAPPSSAKELTHSLLVELFDGEALALKPPAQVGCQPKLLTARLPRVTLLGEELGIIVQVRFQGPEAQTLRGATL